MEVLLCNSLEKPRVESQGSKCNIFLLSIYLFGRDRNIVGIEFALHFSVVWRLFVRTERLDSQVEIVFSLELIAGR